MPTLAQLSFESVPPLVVVLLGGSAALFLLNQAITFWKEHLREKPAPADTYATKEEHGELKVRVDGIDGKVEANFRELDRKRSVSIAGLHDDLTAKTDAIREAMKQDSDRVQARFGEVLEKLGELRGKTSAK